LQPQPAAKVKLMVEQILQRILEGEFNYDNVMKLTDDSTLGKLAYFSFKIFLERREPASGLSLQTI
jgi:hypothetical protein